MIRFVPPREPADFDQKCRQPGKEWQNENPGSRRPRDFWSHFKPQLADGFHQLCAYSAMIEPVGTVDHFKSCRANPELAYEWSNYRFASGWINSSKQDAEVLDPFEVGEGWFEILLPSLQLVLTDQVPANYRALAEYTLQRLNLRDDERVLRQRRGWYRRYQEGKLSLSGLREVAPLIARAVAKANPVVAELTLLRESEKKV